jgi:ribosomal protein S18 acetylase RimI-like enzyme
VAELIDEAFAHEIDERGRAALREMRWMARLSPLIWWWAQADPAFRDSFGGFVWEEPVRKGRSRRTSRQIVGNASLNRAPGSRQRWIICNVVVDVECRGQGIGRQLVEAALDEAGCLGASEVLLQVHRHNQVALELYESMGFREIAGESDLRLETVRSVAFLEAPGYHLRHWQPADGEAAYELARHVIPEALQWIRPLRAEEYRLDWLMRAMQWVLDLMAGRRVYRLVALKEERLVAMLTVTAVFRRGKHQLALLVHPNHTGQVEAALVSRALHMLAAIPSQPVRVTVDKDDEAAQRVLTDYGFREVRTLLTMIREPG